MKRKLAIGMLAMSLLLSNSIVSLAANAKCSSSYDKYHHFDSHRTYNSGYSVPGGSCTYIYGYKNGIPQYKHDCELTKDYAYCDYICSFCGATMDGGQHPELISVRHSIVHN